VHLDDLTPAGCRPVAVAGGLSTILLLLVTGCGGGSAAPAVASLGGTTTAAATAANSPAGAGFPGCMRAHGVASFPDQNDAGPITLGSKNGLDPASPQFRSAERACQGLLSSGRLPTPSSPAQQHRMQTQMLKFAACMRSHGFPAFPDPTFANGATKITVVGNLPGAGAIDPASPRFQTAQKVCQRDLAGTRRT
jgi:hypothetical protein